MFPFDFQKKQKCLLLFGFSIPASVERLVPTIIHSLHSADDEVNVESNLRIPVSSTKSRKSHFCRNHFVQQHSSFRFPSRLPTSRRKLTGGAHSDRSRHKNGRCPVVGGVPNECKLGSSKIELDIIILSS